MPSQFGFKTPKKSGSKVVFQSNFSETSLHEAAKAFLNEGTGGNESPPQAIGTNEAVTSKPGSWHSFHKVKTTDPVIAKEGRLKLLKVGADVEFFLKDYKGNPVPVIGLIGGTKSEPMPILDAPGYALQEDNVALEFNIPAASDVHEWVYSLMRIKEEINRRVKEKGLRPAIESSMRFEVSQLEHPQAKVFGCEPDFNVWEQCVNEKPSVSPESATLRTAGGHVHVSFLIDGKVPTMENLPDVEAMVMALDIFLGVPFSLIDKDTERRKMYGRAGAFRPKLELYGGLEYRVLGPCWTKSPALMAYVYDQVKRAIHYVGNRTYPRDKLLPYKSRVYSAINEGDKNQAQYLLSSFHILMPGQTEEVTF